MKKKTIKYIFVILIILILAITITLVNKNGGKDNNLKTLNVCEVTRSVFYAPQYVAINNGFF